MDELQTYQFLRETMGGGNYPVGGNQGSATQVSLHFHVCLFRSNSLSLTEREPVC